MPQSWLTILQELKTYLDQNTDIEISANSICIPADKRPDFYALFNKAGLSFIQGNYPQFIERGNALARAWAVARQQLVHDLELKELKIPADTHWFLENPSDGLMRHLIDSLFDVLRGKLDAAGFEERAKPLVAMLFDRFFRDGYRLWGTAALLNLMSTDRAYEVPVPDYYDPGMADMTDLRPGTFKDTVPLPRATHRLVFEKVPLCTFLVPTALVHAGRLDSFVALRESFCEARWQARTYSPGITWQNIQDLGKGYSHGEFWPDLALYINTDLKELNLIADYYRISRPEIILEFRGDAGWYEKEGIDSIRRHHDALRPRLGSFVICREFPPDAAFRALLQDLGIRLLSVGYDMNKLEPVVRALMSEDSP